MAIGEGEVGRVVGHGVTLVLYANAHIRKREVGRRLLRDGDRLNTVSLTTASRCVECILQFHIRIERIVLRATLSALHTIVDRCRDPRLIGEELTQIEVGRESVVARCLLLALVDALLDATEAIGDVAAVEIDGTKVGELHVEFSACGPASLVVILQQAELVDPHLTALLLTTEVAHTDDHRLHLAERRITDDGDLVGWLVGIVGHKGHAEAGRTCGLGLVACLLHGRKDLERDVEHVFLGPYGDTSLTRIAIVAARGGERQRNLILVVVVLIIGTEADKDCQLTVLQSSRVRVEGIGVCEHLDALVLAEIEGGVLIDCLRLARAQAVDRHSQSLLVALHELRLRRILLARDARRENIVDRHLVRVFLDAHSADGHRARGRGGVC